MTATERIRAMLDERGVEWEDASPVPSMHPWKTSYISFTGEEVTISCYDEPKWLMGTMVFLTPEQAIAATLGTGTCHDKNGFDVTLGFECTVCGAMTDGYMLTPADTGHYKQFNFCPMCGRRIEQ